MDFSLFAGAMSSLKTASDITKGLVDIRDGTMLQSKVIELQRHIVDAQSNTLATQSELLTLLAKMKELEEEVGAFKRWDAMAARYQLKDFGGNTYAYELRDDAGTGEPKHRLCAPCFSNQKRSILQFLSHSEGRDYYDCLGCKTRQHFGTRVEEPLDDHAVRSTRRDWRAY